MNSLARITTKTSASVIDVNPDAVIDFILLQQQQQQRPIAEAPAAAAATSRHGILVCLCGQQDPQMIRLAIQWSLLVRYMDAIV